MGLFIKHSLQLLFLLVAGTNRRKIPCAIDNTSDAVADLLTEERRSIREYSRCNNGGKNREICGVWHIRNVLNLLSLCRDAGRKQCALGWSDKPHSHPIERHKIKGAARKL